jgi:hypothetical protein
LSYQVRICRFLTENIVSLRAFLLANFEISNSYSFGLEVAYDLLFFAPFRSTQNHEKNRYLDKTLNASRGGKYPKNFQKNLAPNDSKSSDSRVQGRRPMADP